MIKSIDHKKMGRGIHGWLDSHFHFSFAEYYNPQNLRFGVLRVMNDDLVQCGTGFDTHPHEDMEIISYVVNGELTHKDSMGNQRTLSRGQIQYMSAGTGVTHSEYNHGKELLRFFQIWIFPDQEGYRPNYGDVLLKLEDRFDKWLVLASSVDNGGSKAPVKVHQDINAWAAIIGPGKSLDIAVAPDRQAYLALIEGSAALRGAEGSSASLEMRDAAEISGESFTITARPAPEASGPDANPGAHVIVIEMARG
jgi:redox-sensitive bicupin YhaK (pirin superfamily)